MTELPLNLIQTDIKNIEPGDWFLPMTLKGVNQHSLLSEALSKGIAGFVYEKGAIVPSTDKPHFQVPNLRDYLFNLAECKRPSLKAKVAVVTGSAGKTSVKELTGAILRSGAPNAIHISPENQNTKIALATQILRMPLDVNAAVFEMGARKLGDFVTPLKFLKPEIAVLLNVGTAHLGEFGSQENLITEKLSVLRSPSVRTLIAPSDDPRIWRSAVETEKEIISFGHEKIDDSVQSHVQILNESENKIELSINGQNLAVTCDFQSPARALNVAASIALSMAFSVPLEQIQKAINNFSGVARRFQLFDWNGTQAIDDAFNASPESLEAGLHLVKHLYPDQRILLVLGSMLELGSATITKHHQAAHLILNLYEDSIRLGKLSIVTVGQDAREIANEVLALGFPTRQVNSFATVLEAKPLIQEVRKEFQLIYVKGSKSIQLQEIFDHS